MVFRGKPSKACERCRARRLKCDLHSVACGQCIRASAPCAGYRDTQQLRIRNESQLIARKALKNAPPFEPKSLPLSIDLQARYAFFAYYVSPKCWDFLKPYYHPTDSPEHLTLAIEAISLAYLWHRVYSDAALSAARERYISALRMTNKVLKSSKEVAKETTLLASLLLDLFEKITHSGPQNNKSWTSHVNGALALVTFRGLEQFQDPSEFQILVRLSGNSILSFVVGGSPVPVELNAIHAYIGNNLNAQSPTWRLSDLMVQYANLRSKFRRGILSSDESIQVSIELDAKLRALDLELPSSWQYSTTLLDYKSDSAFDLHFNSYSDPRVCYARNILRVIRILLNESLIEYYLALPQRDKHLELTAVAYETIEILAGEICACVPQYVDCNGAARQRQSNIEKSKHPDQTPDHNLDHNPHRAGHPHSHSQQSKCYSLIFPLYVVGRSKAVPDVGPWAINQLHYMGSHFYIRNAEVVAGLLERETDVSPWEVYAMLGSYALAA